MSTMLENLDSAARNAWAVTFGDGVEPYQPTPSTVVHAAPHETLRRYDRTTAASGNPVLLVPPLAVVISCYDLRPSQSVVEFLLEIGKQPYVVDYGDITWADRNMGLEDWTHRIVPDAVRRVSEAHGGAPVDLIGWSFGGMFSVLTAAAHADLPIASVTAVGVPFDQTKNPGTALPRLVGPITGGREVAYSTWMFGGIPKQLVRAGFRIQALEREITRPLFIGRNILDTEALARMESVDRFMARMPGYPGRFYRQVYRRLILRNELITGTVHIRSDLAVELAKLTCRVLLIGSKSDLLAPAASVEGGRQVLTGASEVRYEQVRGSHLGMLTAPEARDSAWKSIAEFLG
ncbi:alpha/beta fold hydrolase [Antrihabitans sp. NCIMB 15449]|uniref:Alpha/beta fold hydrolase n=1 Tax=Antrihabitans spumae TaxID=3373370 RepID=A0ABW7JM32_9NOCA